MLGGILFDSSMNPYWQLIEVFRKSYPCFTMRFIIYLLHICHEIISWRRAFSWWLTSIRRQNKTVAYFLFAWCPFPCRLHRWSLESWAGLPYQLWGRSDEECGCWSLRAAGRKGSQLVPHPYLLYCRWCALRSLRSFQPLMSKSLQPCDRRIALCWRQTQRRRKWKYATWMLPTHYLRQSRTVQRHKEELHTKTQEPSS